MPAHRRFIGVRASGKGWLFIRSYVPRVSQSAARCSSTVRSGMFLVSEGLLDELHLFVFPVVLGSGKRLFATPGDKLPLRLIDSATYDTRVVHLTYTKA